MIQPYGQAQKSVNSDVVVLPARERCSAPTMEGAHKSLGEMRTGLQVLQARLFYSSSPWATPARSEMRVARPCGERATLPPWPLDHAAGQLWGFPAGTHNAGAAGRCFEVLQNGPVRNHSLTGHIADIMESTRLTQSGPNCP